MSANNKPIARANGIADTSPTLKWNWMVDWCKRKGISPYDSKNWDRAEKEWEKANGIGGGEPTFDGIKYGNVIPAEPSADHRVSDWSAIQTYLLNLKEGERVVECGVSGMTGTKGTVYISKGGDVCVRWDNPKGMGTSATGGTRRISDVITESPKPDESPKKISAEGYRQHLDEMLEKSEPHNCCQNLNTLEANRFREHLQGAIQLGELSREVESEIEYLVHLHVAVQKPTPPKPDIPVKRWKLDRSGEGPDEMTQDKRGAWVRFEAYESDLAAARAERDEYKRAFDVASDALAPEIEEVKRLRAALEAYKKWEGAVSRSRPDDSNAVQNGRVELLQIAKDLRDKALAQASPNSSHAPAGWMPIETAPKDGTKILLYVVHPADDYAKTTGHPDGWNAVESGYWNAHPDRGWENETAGTPTHWMPIPTAPASSGKGEG